jgi:hypothetical protein
VCSFVVWYVKNGMATCTCLVSVNAIGIHPYMDLLT